MHEDYLQIVRDVFSAYTDAEITDTTLKDFLMQVGGFWLIYGAFRAAPDFRLAVEAISYKL